MKLIGKNSASNVSDIVKRSSKAVCGSFEREVIVPASKVSATKTRLRKAGFMIVGTSEPNGRTRKIWFINRGLAGL